MTCAATGRFELTEPPPSDGPPFCVMAIVDAT